MGVIEPFGAQRPIAPPQIRLIVKRLAFFLFFRPIVPLDCLQIVLGHHRHQTKMPKFESLRQDLRFMSIRIPVGQDSLGIC